MVVKLMLWISAIVLLIGYCVNSIHFIIKENNTYINIHKKLD